MVPPTRNAWRLASYDRLIRTIGVWVLAPMVGAKI
jgi:hypothetical protein